MNYPRASVGKLGAPIYGWPNVLIKVIFWDMGRVLIYFEHMATCRALARFSHLKRTKIQRAAAIYVLLFESKFFYVYESGKLDSIAFYEAVKEKIEATEELTFEVFCDMWGNIFRPIPNMVKVIHAIKPDIRQFIISNTNPIHWRWICREYPELVKPFPESQRLLSHEMGGMKDEWFGCAISLTGVDSSNILLIDDTRANVEKFREHGGHGLVYNGANPRQLKILIKHLIAYGVLQNLPIVSR